MLHFVRSPQQNSLCFSVRALTPWPFPEWKRYFLIYFLAVRPTVFHYIPLQSAFTINTTAKICRAVWASWFTSLHLYILSCLVLAVRQNDRRSHEKHGGHGARQRSGEVIIECFSFQIINVYSLVFLYFSRSNIAK